MHTSEAKRNVEAMARAAFSSSASDLSREEQEKIVEDGKKLVMAMATMRSVQHHPDVALLMRTDPVRIEERFPTVMSQNAVAFFLARLVELCGSANYTDHRKPFFNIFEMQVATGHPLILPWPDIAEAVRLYRGFLEKALGKDSTDFQAVMRLADLPGDVDSPQDLNAAMATFGTAFDTLCIQCGYGYGLDWQSAFPIDTQQ